MIALLALASAAEPAWDDVLAAAVERNRAGLALPEAPPLYHLRLQLLSLDQVDVRASMGALVSEDHGGLNLLGVEVRVGEPKFDNTGFAGWQNGFARAQLPVALTSRALEAEIWRTTDVAYKEAVEQYARKRAQFEAPEDWPGDYALTGAVTADDGAARAEAAPDRLVALARGLSARLVPAALPKDVTVEAAEVFVGHEAGALWTVDSEGTRVRAPLAETSIRALLQIRTADGALLTDQRLFTVRGVEDLPDDTELFGAIDHLRDDLLAVAVAEPLGDEYVGPVVFADGAAADLFRWLLVPQLEGTPPEIPFDSWFGELGAGNDPVRLGRRVLPPGWGVVDDPRALPRHPGSFAHDQEGTPSERVALVSDGIVRTVLMSRVPRKGVAGTNGHARGVLGARAEGRASHVSVAAERARSEDFLGKSAARLAKDYGRDWWLEVRRLQEPSVMGHGTDYWFDPDETPLPPPVAVVKRWADGREQLLRGARFASVARFLLRDIAAAGPRVAADYLASVTRTGGGPTSGLPTHLEAPEVLIGEVEVAPAPGDPSEVPLLATAP